MGYHAKARSRNLAPRRNIALFGFRLYLELWHQLRAFQFQQ